MDRQRAERQDFQGRVPALIGARAAATLASFALLALPLEARAEDRVRECVAAHAEGQLLRNQGRLLAATAKFTDCMAENCPALVRDECAALEQQVRALQPSVVLAALGPNGQPWSAPVVSVDGSSVFTRLDGKPLALDPGQHRFRFHSPDGDARDVELSLGQSERERAVTADFRPASDAVSASKKDRVARTLILVSGGVAAVALGGFTYFAISGRAIEDDLDRCKPNCTEREDLDRMQTRYLLADVSLGVALASLGVGAFVWLKRPSAFASSGLTLGVRPRVMSRGGGVWAIGEF